jgi:hypothetical protein
LAPNVITVSNVMGTVNYSFSFINDKLAHVSMNVYMD